MLLVECLISEKFIKLSVPNIVTISKQYIPFVIKQNLLHQHMLMNSTQRFRIKFYVINIVNVHSAHYVEYVIQILPIYIDCIKHSAMTCWDHSL